MIKYIVYDTETTGLNIIKDKPFLIIYRLLDEKLQTVEHRQFGVENLIELSRFFSYLNTVPTHVGQNIKFDMHMCTNIGYNFKNFADKNFIETNTLARLVIDHDVQTDKGFRLDLKTLAVRYLNATSARQATTLRAEYSALISAHKQAMLDYFKAKGLWKTTTTQESRALINAIYNSWHKIFHLVPTLKDARAQFLLDNPVPTYAQCPSVFTYADQDVEMTHGLFAKWYGEVVHKQQVPTLIRISRALYPLFLMERKGLSVDMKRIIQDRNELLKAQAALKIIDPRTGMELSVNQHARLKDLYEYETGMSLKNADKNTRLEIEDKSPSAKKANVLAKIAKMLNTYITGVLSKVTVVDGDYKIFTQFNMAGTVTGRLSSNFQQFPKEPFELPTGYNVDVRSWFVTPKQDRYMFYFDYSQMELRLQCEWTNVVNGAPDMNLARAFSPYKCIHYTSLHEFDGVGAHELRPGAPIDIPLEKALKQGWSAWVDPATNQYWKPVDLHATTAKNAFPNITETDPDWDHYRGLGKRTNFAVNYGASAAKIQSALKTDFKTATALVDGYRKTFAGVVAFGKWISRRVYITTNIPNLLLRRYYSRNKHQLQNWLVQGSGADVLLEKLYELHQYIQDKPHWSLMLTVHDEIDLACKDIPLAQLDKEVKEIRELLTYHMSAVDIVSDVEFTLTRWSDKDDWKGVPNGNQQTN